MNSAVGLSPLCPPKEIMGTVLEGENEGEGERENERESEGEGERGPTTPNDEQSLPEEEGTLSPERDEERRRKAREEVAYLLQQRENLRHVHRLLQQQHSLLVAQRRERERGKHVCGTKQEGNSRLEHEGERDQSDVSHGFRVFENETKPEVSEQRSAKTEADSYGENAEKEHRFCSTDTTANGGSTRFSSSAGEQVKERREGKAGETATEEERFKDEGGATETDAPGREPGVHAEAGDACVEGSSEQDGCGALVQSEDEREPGAAEPREASEPSVFEAFEASLANEMKFEESCHLSSLKEPSGPSALSAVSPVSAGPRSVAPNPGEDSQVSALGYEAASPSSPRRGETASLSASMSHLSSSSFQPSFSHAARLPSPSLACLSSRLAAVVAAPSDWATLQCTDTTGPAFGCPSLRLTPAFVVNPFRRQEDLETQQREEDREEEERGEEREDNDEQEEETSVCELPATCLADGRVTESGEGTTPNAGYLEEQSVAASSSVSLESTQDRQRSERGCLLPGRKSASPLPPCVSSPLSSHGSSPLPQQPSSLSSLLLNGQRSPLCPNSSSQRPSVASLSLKTRRSRERNRGENESLLSPGKKPGEQPETPNCMRVSEPRETHSQPFLAGGESSGLFVSCVALNRGEVSRSSSSLSSSFSSRLLEQADRKSTRAGNSQADFSEQNVALTAPPCSSLFFPPRTRGAQMSPLPSPSSPASSPSSSWSEACPFRGREVSEPSASLSLSRVSNGSLFSASFRTSCPTPNSEATSFCASAAAGAFFPASLPLHQSLPVSCLLSLNPLHAVFSRGEKRTSSFDVCRVEFLPTATCKASLLTVKARAHRAFRAEMNRGSAGARKTRLREQRAREKQRHMHAKEQRRHAAETWEATRRRQREEEKTTELGVTLAASQSSLCSSLSEEESEEEPEEKNVFAEAEGLRDEKGRLICVPSVFVSPSFSTLLRVSAYIRAHAEERDLEETEEEEAGMLVLGWREILEHRWGQCDRLTQPNLQALLQAFMPRTWFHFFQLAHLSSSSFFSSLFPAAAMAHASALSPPNPLSSAFLEERLAAFSLLRNRLYDMRHRLACCSRSLLPARSLSRLRKDRGAATPRMQEEGNDTENGAEGAEGVDAGREEDASRDASFLSREAPECLDSWKSEATRHEAEAGQQGLLSLLGEVSQLYLQLVKMIQELQVSRFGRQKWLASETPEVSPPHLSGVSEPSPSPSFSSSFSSSSSPSFSSFSSSFLPSVPARAEHRVFQKLVVLQQSVDSFLAASCCMEKWAADLVLSQRVARALERRARETASLEKRETPALSWRFGVRASVQADRKQLETTGETTRGDTPQRQTEAHPPEQTTFFSVSPAHVESQQKFIKKVVKTCVRDTQQLDRLRDALIELMYLRGEERGSEEEGPALVASSSAVASASNARAAGAEASEKEFPFSSFPLHFRDQLGLTAESAVSLLLLSFALEARRPAAVCLAFLRASAPHLLRPSLSSSSASSSSLCSASLSSCLASLLPPGYLEDPEALAVEAVRVEGEDSRREEETAEEGASTERQCGEEERGRDTRREEKHGAREREPSVGEQHWEEFLRALDDPREAPGQERTDERRVCQKETASSQIQLPFLASGSSVPGSTLESHDPAQIPGDAEGGGLSAFPTGAKGRARVRSPEEGAFSKLERLLDPTLLDPVGLKRFLGLPSSEGFTGPSGVPPLSAFVEDAFSLSSGDAAALWREVRGSATRREARQLLRSPLQTPVRDDENAREGRSRGPQKPLNPTLRLPDFSDQVSFPHTALGVGEKQRLAEKTGEKDTREKRRQLVCSSLPPVGRRLELRARQRESRRRNLEFVARGNSVFSPGDTGAVGLHAGVAARTRFQAETVREEPDRARGRNFAEEERARREREFARKSTHEALRSAYARRRELEKRAELPRDAFPEETLPEDFSEGETRRASSAGFFIEEEEAECRFGGSPEDRAGSGEVEGMSFRETFPCLRRTVEGDDEDERADEKETARMARVCHYERKDEESRRSGSALSVENRSRENKQDEGSLEADWRLRGSAAARASTPETEPTVEPERGRRRRGAVARSRSLDEETVGDTLETETEPRDRAANEKGNMRDRRLREDAHAVALQQARLSGRLEEIERRVHEKRDALRQCEEEFSSLNVPQLARFFSSSMSTAVPSQVPPAVARSVSLLRDRRRKTAKELKETEARKSELCALLAALANRKQVLNAELRRRCRQQALRQVELPEKDEKAREQRATDVLRETERNGARPRGLRRQSQGDQGSFPAKGEIGEQGEGSPDFAFALPASPERTGGNRPWFSTPSIRELTAGLFSPQNNRGMPEESEQGNPPTAREAGERGTPKESDAGDRHAGKKQETVKQRSMSRGRSSSRMGASVARDMSRESKWGECISEREGSSEKKSERGRSRQNSRARETQAQQGEKKGDSPSRSRGDNKGTEAPAPPVEAAEPCEESRGEGPRKSGGMLFSGLKSFLDLAQESPQKVLESVRQKQKGSPEEDEVMASRFASWPRRLSPSGRVRSQETQEETAVSGGECPSLAPCLHLVPRRERDDVSLCFQEELEAEMQAFEGSEEVRRPARSGGERAEGETAVEAPERSGKDESAFSPRGPREEAQKAKRIASAFSPSTVEKRLTPASGPGEAATRKDAEKVEKEKVEKEKVEKEKVEKVEEGRQEKGEKAEESRGVSWQLEKRSGAKKREQSLTRGPSAATTRASRLRALDSREKRQSLQSEQKVAEHKHVLHASPEAGRRGTKRESEKKEERGHTHTRVERKRESKATGTTDRGQTSFSSFSSSTPSSATSSSTPSSASSSSTPSSSSSSTPSSSSSSTPSSSSSSTSASSSSTSASSSSTSASCSSTSASSSSSSGLRLFDGKQEIRQRRAKVLALAAKQREQARKRKGDLQSLGAHRETEASVRLPSKGESYPSFEGKQEEKRSASKETNKEAREKRAKREKREEVTNGPATTSTTLSSALSVLDSFSSWTTERPFSAVSQAFSRLSAEGSQDEREHAGVRRAKNGESWEVAREEGDSEEEETLEIQRERETETVDEEDARMQGRTRERKRGGDTKETEDTSVPLSPLANLDDLWPEMEDLSKPALQVASRACSSIHVECSESCLRKASSWQGGAVYAESRPSRSSFSSFSVPRSNRNVGGVPSTERRWKAEAEKRGGRREKEGEQTEETREEEKTEENKEANEKEEAETKEKERGTIERPRERELLPTVVENAVRLARKRIRDKNRLFRRIEEAKQKQEENRRLDLFARRDQRLRLFIRRQQEELRRLQASHAETLGASSDADLRAFSIPSVPSPSLSAEVSEILSQGPLVLQDGVVVLTEGQAALAAAREAARLLGPEGERLCKQGASEERRREGAEQRVAWEKEREQYAAGKITPEFPGNNAHLDEVREDAGGRVEATAADSGASVHRGDSRFEEWFLPRDGLLEEREELDEFDPTQTSPPLLRQSAPVRSESYGTTRCSSYVEDGKGGEREKGVSVETRRELSENGAASPAVSDVADVRLNSQFSEGDALQRETSGLGEPDRSLRGESPRDKTLASGNRTADVLTLRDCGRGTGSPRAVSRAGLCPPSARQAEKPEQCELAARLEKLETSRKELQEIRSKTSAATDTGLDGPWFGTPSSRVAVRTSLSLMLQKVEPRACGVQPLASQERRIVTPRQLGRESNSVLLAMFLDSQKMEESGADTESEERLRGASASLVAKHSTGSGTEAVGVTLAALVSSSSSGSLTTRGAAGAAGRDRGKASMQMQQKTRGVSQTARTEEGRDRDDRLSLLSLEDSGILDSPRSWTTREEESAWAGYFQQVAEERKWPTFAEGVRDGTRGDSDGPRSGGHARSTERSLCPAVDAREIREDGRGNVGEEMWRESGGDEETRFAEQAEGRKGGESVTPSFASFAAVAAERQRLRSARDKRREDLGRIEEDVRADVEIQCAVDRLVETEHTSQGRRLLREGRLRGRYATENEDCYYTVELENEF